MSVNPFRTCPHRIGLRFLSIILLHTRQKCAGILAVWHPKRRAAAPMCADSHVSAPAAPFSMPAFPKTFSYGALLSPVRALARTLRVRLLCGFAAQRQAQASPDPAERAPLPILTRRRVLLWEFAPHKDIADKMYKKSYRPRNRI